MPAQVLILSHTFTTKSSPPGFRAHAARNGRLDSTKTAPSRCKQLRGGFKIMSASTYFPTYKYAVSLAMRRLTSGFGMEPGVPASLRTPTNSYRVVKIWGGVSTRRSGAWPGNAKYTLIGVYQPEPVAPADNQLLIDREGKELVKQEISRTTY